MEKSSQDQPTSQGQQPPAPVDATGTEVAASASDPAHDILAGQTSTAAPGSQDKGLSRTQHVVELADSLSTIADQLHERIMREIRGYGGGSVPDQVQATLRKLFDDETVLRQRANALYADAASYVIQGLDQPQSRLVALTTDAAHKIRRIGVIGEVTGLVGGLLLLAGAVASGKPTPVVLALEKIHLHAKTLDALTPTPPGPTA